MPASSRGLVWAGLLAAIGGTSAAPSCGPEGSCPAAEAPPENLGEALGVPYVSYMLSGIPPPAGRPMGAKFRNFRSSDVEMRWDDGSRDGAYSGLILSMRGSSTNTYEGHRFRIVDPKTKKHITTLTMQTGKSIYIIEPDNPATLKTDAYQKTMREAEYLEQYYAKKGFPWLAHYPRAKPVLPFWPASRIGQEHHVSSEVGHLRCDLASGGSSCQAPRAELTLKALSLRPRVFLIENLLSPFEVEAMMTMGKTTVKRSTVGQGATSYTSKTRTSSTGWLSRTQSPILDTLFRRFADALNISEAKLHHNKNAENLQVVHYKVGAEYSPHHDFGDDGNRQNSRFLTLFIYLKPAEQGGGTSFPNAFGGRGMKVFPKPGSALLWYNMLEDGNGDEASLHAGMPVEAGEKWAMNLWLWDPHI